MTGAVLGLRLATLTLCLCVHACVCRYLHETVHLRNTEARSRLLLKLSPAMQGEVSLLVNQRWVSKIWYLAHGSQLELLIDIASRLKPQVFPPWEFCPCGFMYIVNRGTALYAGRPKHEGSAWGEDVLLNRPDLQLDFEALAATYLWVFTIDGTQLNKSISKFPESGVVLSAVQRRWALRRAIVRHAERLSYERGIAFRGRYAPIYAKEIKAKLAARRLKLEPSKTVRASRLDNLDSLSSALSQRDSQTVPPPTPVSSSGLLCAGSPSSPSGRPHAPFHAACRARPRPPPRPHLPPPHSTFCMCHRSSPFIKALPNYRSRKSPSASETTITSSSAMKAAANFGLHRREEQLRRALTEDESQSQMLVKLRTDVGALQSDMREVLALLKEGRGVGVGANGHGANGHGAAGAPAEIVLPPGSVRMGPSIVVPRVVAAAPLSGAMARADSMSRGRARNVSFTLDGASASSEMSLVDDASGLQVRVPEV